MECSGSVASKRPRRFKPNCVSKIKVLHLLNPRQLSEQSDLAFLDKVPLTLFMLNPRAELKEFTVIYISILII